MERVIVGRQMDVLRFWCKGSRNDRKRSYGWGESGSGWKEGGRVPGKVQWNECGWLET